MEFDEREESVMGKKNVLDLGTHLYDRFADCMKLATNVMARAQAVKLSPTIVQVYTPTVMDPQTKSWGFKTARVWWSPRGRYMVGHDVDDPRFTPRIYRRKWTDKPPGGQANPTYEMFVTTVWSDSDMTRLEQSLRSVA